MRRLSADKALLSLSEVNLANPYPYPPCHQLFGLLPPSSSAIAGDGLGDLVGRGVGLSVGAMVGCMSGSTSQYVQHLHTQKYSTVGASDGATDVEGR